MDLSEIRRLTWDTAIRLAREGDSCRLAPLLRSDVEIPPFVRKFLAGVVAGDVKLKRHKKLTYDMIWSRYNREQLVVSVVRSEMHGRGRQRDKQLRTGLIRQWCKVYETTPSNVERYLHLSKSRRRHPNWPKSVANKRTTP